MTGQRGSATLEWVLLVPLVALLLGVLVVALRVSSAHQQVAHAGAAAARAGSLARSAQEADAAARQSAAGAMPACAGAEVRVDTSGFAVPVGTPAELEVSITCPVRLGDLGLPLPGTVTVETRQRAALDTYRGRR